MNITNEQLSALLDKEIANLIISKWQFLNENYPVVQLKKFHRTNDRNIEKMDTIKKLVCIKIN
jgi:hypothetical protein